MEHVGRQISHGVLEQYRFRAIKLWQADKKVNDIADSFGVSRVSVSRWIRAYKTKGKRALYSKKAHGPKEKLSREDTKHVIQALKRPAVDYGFDTPLWTCERLRQVIKKETKKSLHTSNVWRRLKSWGYSNQKPERRALQA